MKCNKKFKLANVKPETVIKLHLDNMSNFYTKDEVKKVMFEMFQTEIKEYISAALKAKAS